MSYESFNSLPKGTSLKHVINLIELLGYTKIHDGFKIEKRVAQYAWVSKAPDVSFVGVELDISYEETTLLVHTRTRLGRSYWDLEKQNQTIKYLRDFFGGSFITDEGKGRYLKPDAEEPSRLASELFVARWVFHNSLVLPQLFLSSRKLEGDIAKEEPIGWALIDNINPRFFSNYTIIPYIIGAWEEYLRASFLAFLHQGECPSKIFRNIRIHPDDYVSVIRNQKTLEEVVAEALSFQRPSIIDNNFKMINEKIDVAGCLRKPYRKRKICLYDFMDSLVDERNEFVHRGSMQRYLTDGQTKKIVNDVEIAGDRIYDLFGQVYGLELSKEF